MIEKFLENKPDAWLKRILLIIMIINMMKMYVDVIDDDDCIRILRFEIVIFISRFVNDNILLETINECIIDDNIDGIDSVAEWW